MKNIIDSIVKKVVNLFANPMTSALTGLSSASFVGIRNYVSSTSGEIANHVILANFSYGNAVKNDLKKLQNTTQSDIQEIVEKFGFSVELINTAIAKLIDSFVKNQNPETRSNQSKGQTDAYVNISDCIRLHIESQKIYIYGLGISKEIIQKGEYKSVNSRELTLCQNAVKKHFNLSTAKFKQYIIEPDQIGSVKVNGTEYAVN
jgi:hypothetical protein